MRAILTFLITAIILGLILGGILAATATHVINPGTCPSYSYTQAPVMECPDPLQYP